MINTVGQLVYQTSVADLNEVHCTIPTGESKLLWVVIEGNDFSATKVLSVK
jgi:hypothetical protein